jgi:hypothetical protein
MRSPKIYFFIVLLLGTFELALGQYLKTDTTIIFTPSNPNLIRKDAYRPSSEGWGMDIMMSNNGFALGGFYRYELDQALSLGASLAISDVKDDAEFEQYDYYGQSYVPGKKNRLLMIPLMATIQYRLFQESIADNFRPFVGAGFGPTMVFVAPYTYDQIQYDFWGTPYKEKMDFFSSLKYGHPRYTLGGYISAGAFFGLDKGTISGLSVKYFWAPFPDGIEVMEGGYIKNFGGLYITLTFGSMF